MNNQELASQVLITGFHGINFLPDYTINLLTEIPAGAVMFFRQNISTNKEILKNLIQEINEIIILNSGIAPFIAVDLEGGTVNRFSHNTQLPNSSSLPDASSYWNLAQDIGITNALKKIEEDAFLAGIEIAELGFNMNFAPVAEILNKENYNFLRRRSYGEDPDFVTNASISFINGFSNAGVLCVVKHFPGSAGIDPHYHASIMDLDKNEVDFFVNPFRIIVNQSKNIALMAAHTLVPVIDSDNIASLSNVFLKDILRDEWDFKGLIIADDFIMNAAKGTSGGNISPEEAAVKSLIAGCDMILLWPENIRKTYNTILNAIETGELTRERLEESVTRIIYYKIILKNSV